MALKKKQLSELKDIIQAERERVINSFEMSEENFQRKNDEGKDEVDVASSEYETSQMLRFRNRDVFYSKKLLKSLEKMTTGEYGECEDCGDDIRFERLKARPTAQLCITCKDEAEREESNNYIAKQSKSLGKKIDLNTTL
jgi:DnaK suppressor protein